MSSPQVPFLTAEQMREVDRLMVEEYGILLLQMMENAGRALARLARERFFDGDPRGRTAVVLAGQGGNGGGGLVCARRLATWGANIRVYLATEPERLTAVPRQQLNILQRMAVPVMVATESTVLPETDLLIDALLGYSLRGAPREIVGTLIRVANADRSPVLALDLPSGLEATSGAVYDPTVRAAATLTLALPKTGLRALEARDSVGDLYLADIGVPPSLYSQPSLGVHVGPLFAQDDIIRLW